MTLLISGPRKPGNNNDVYLAHLINDLNTLWNNGVQTYDAHKQETFNLKVMLLWTVNDFPAYDNLSYFSVKDYKAYPICDEGTDCQYLKHSRKLCYMGHRKFLTRNYVYRNWKNTFNGAQERNLAPQSLTRKEILEIVSKLQYILGKKIQVCKKKKKRRSKVKVVKELKGCWKKKSIVFFLAEILEHLV